MRTLDGLVARLHREQLLALHRNAQRLLDPLGHGDTATDQHHPPPRTTGRDPCSHASMVADDGDRPSRRRRLLGARIGGCQLPPQLGDTPPGIRDET
ncbi:MAG: hypothetical protein QOI54_3388 [Actinomycetota bacterium]|nr:hypothetical protein [Actinomycetota bacterium]